MKAQLLLISHQKNFIPSGSISLEAVTKDRLCTGAGIHTVGNIYFYNYLIKWENTNGLESCQVGPEVNVNYQQTVATSGTTP